VQPSEKTVSGRWVAIAIAVVIFVAVTVACFFMFRNYLAAPRQP
jgi:flagellar basal body-associated protein FliL